MPIRSPRLCGCGKIVPSGIRCECQQRADRERKARNDANRPSARERGYGTKWQQARAGYLISHPTCTMCGKPATIVDHVTPHKGDDKLFWRRSNWQPLCVPCHSGKKQREDLSKIRAINSL